MKRKGSKRKKPVRHTVRSHTRNGCQVRSYVRGTSKQKRVVRAVKKPKPFTVNLTYSNRKGDGETVVVISTSYARALAEAFEEKKDPRDPIEIEIIDPDWGKVLHIIGRGIKKTAAVGGKFFRAVGKQAKEIHYTAKVKGLIRDAYSDDKVKRTYARHILRERYPSVWNLMDISRR